MTAIIHIISFLVIALTAGYLLKVTLSDMLPFVWCGIILVLYVLAFVRALKLIDIVMPLAALALAVYVLWSEKNKNKNKNKADHDTAYTGLRLAIAGPLEYAGANILSAGFIIYLVFCIMIPLTQSGRIVTWWDDINYWASDLKSLYYLGGFADKYTNVSSQFGDYPPGLQLAKWYIVHMDGHMFREDLAFTGYFLFNLSFLMPCFKHIKGRNLIALPLVWLAAWAFAGIGDIYGYGGSCADLTMAFLFGSVLICAVDEDSAAVGHGLPFVYIRACVYLSVLVITKSTGVIWALFAVVIWVVYRILIIKYKREGLTGFIIDNKERSYDYPEHRPDMTYVTRKDAIQIISVILGPVITGGVWMLYCLTRHRITQTTSTMVTYITTDKYGLSPYKNEFGAAFVRAFFTEPVHVTHTWFDLSPAAMLALIAVLLGVLFLGGSVHRGAVDTHDFGGKSTAGRGKRFRGCDLFIVIALPVIGLIYYALIYVAHLTIFATETQYLDAEGMIASIERYGAPFVVGCMLFITWIWLNPNTDAGETSEKAPDRASDVSDEMDDVKTSMRLRIKAFLLAVLILTNIPEAYKGLMGYRMEVKEGFKERSAFIDEDSDRFVSAVTGAFGLDMTYTQPNKCMSYAGSNKPKNTDKTSPARYDLGGGARICRIRDGAYYRVQDAYVAYAVSPVSILCPSLDIKDTPEDAFIAAISQTHAGYLYIDWQPYRNTYLDDMCEDGSFRYDTLYRIVYGDGMMTLSER